MVMSNISPNCIPIIIARKPIKGSIIDTVEAFGVGAINVDECRIDFVNEEDYKITANKNQHENFGTKPMTNNNVYGDYSMVQPKNYSSKGRFPANTILTYNEADKDEVIGGFPDTKGGDRHNIAVRQSDKNSGYGFDINIRNEYNDNGSASRYFKNCKYSDKDIDKKVIKRVLKNKINPNYISIVMARKPIKGSIIDNVEKYNTGAINIDECRIGNDVIHGGTMPDFRDVGKKSKDSIGIDKLSFGQVWNAERIPLDDHVGRFPANTVLTYNEADKDEVIGGFPNSIGSRTQNVFTTSSKYGGNSLLSSSTQRYSYQEGYNDSGSASRYFKNCKYSNKDDNERLESKVKEDEKIYKIINGNMLEELDKLEENSIDSIVTDPPYELNFMNKGWDNAGVSFQKETWKKCLRVLKPRRTFIGIWWFKNFS